ncbi:MAG: M15 family metallopeptidase [Bacteroidales bacterium]|jgi:peptidoglycan L-alanyl-D-glutamate endopeptidase CwlK|nr:M15 family metallopeptidase [Bacteroidales bacterium]
MAYRDLSLLTPEMRRKVLLVKQECLKNKVEILFYCTLRPLDEQAVMYRQSNSFAKINAKIAELSVNGFGFLSNIIIDIGAQQNTKWKTNACPGESFHNYGEAVDGVPIVNGRPVWNYEENPRVWDIYGKAVKNAGLEWGGDWKKKDLPHAQLAKGSNPLELYSPEEVKKKLTKLKLL